jgi:hypothetical protein
MRRGCGSITTRSFSAVPMLSIDQLDVTHGILNVSTDPNSVLAYDRQALRAKLFAHGD